MNEEIHDLFAAGADVVQIDEPWLQARADEAREFAVAAINRAVEGVEGTTALHTCFGYAHVVTDKPSGYSFLAELNDVRGRPDRDRVRPARARPLDPARDPRTRP